MSQVCCSISSLLTPPSLWKDVKGNQEKKQQACNRVVLNLPEEADNKQLLKSESQVKAPCCSSIVLNKRRDADILYAGTALPLNVYLLQQIVPFLTCDFAS